MAAEFITASTACIVANMITHPLETIKTFQQLPGQGSISTLSAASKIVGEGGYSSLYKGLNASLVRAVISGGGRLSLFGLFKDVAFDHGKLARNSKGSPIASELPLRGMLASLAGMIAALAGSPADLIRTRQAAFKGTYSQTPSIAGVVKEIFSANGLSGLFAGSHSLLARAFSFNLAQLTTYDYCKKSAMEMLHLEADHVITHVAAAMGAGFAATTVSAPFENIKTMTQMSVSQSITSAATSMYQEGGVYIFFRGWTPLYIKVAPHTLVVFVVAERLRALFSLRPME